MPYCIELTGQEEIVEQLRQQILANVLSTSYLIQGEGVTEACLAKEWAKAVNCREGNLFKKCACTSCGKIERQTHPDVHWIGIEEDRSLKIEAMREVQQKAMLQPYEGQLKVFIMHQAERLTEEAGNSLLKLLEEPPPQNLFILVTEYPDRLLPTIRSRLTTMTMATLTQERLKLLLAQQYQWPAEEINFLAKASDGRLGKAVRLHEKGFFAYKNQLIDGFLNDGSQMLWSEADTTDRQKTLEMLQAFSSFIRDAWVYRLTGNETLVLNQDRLTDVQAYMGEKTLEQIGRAHV